MFTVYPLNCLKILYNRIVKNPRRTAMSVLTLKSDEFKLGFPAVLKDYAAYTVTIKGNSEKTVCEYLLDLRTILPKPNLSANIPPKRGTK